jgi:hypothetical protein
MSSRNISSYITYGLKKNPSAVHEFDMTLRPKCGMQLIEHHVTGPTFFDCYIEFNSDSDLVN